MFKSFDVFPVHVNQPPTRNQWVGVCINGNEFLYKSLPYSDPMRAIEGYLFVVFTVEALMFCGVTPKNLHCFIKGGWVKSVT